MTTVLRRSARRSGRASPIDSVDSKAPSSPLRGRSDLADHFESLSVSPSPSKKGVRRSSRVASRNTSIPTTPIPKKVSQAQETPAVPMKRGRPTKRRTEADTLSKPAISQTYVEGLPGREQEFEMLRDKLVDSITTKQDISGVPGTGKTATVRQCIVALQSGGPHKKSSNFNFLEINGMKLSDVGQTYSILWKAISGKSLSGATALRRLTLYFEKSDSQRTPLVVVLDELDLLLRKKASILYHFFEWCGWQSAKLIVIAIANTMDLPERYLPHRIASRMGSHRINFKPYTYPQLMAIISHRQTEWKNHFHPDALEYCARKVSAVSGDARRALSLAKRAVDWVRSAPSVLSTHKLITIPLMEQAIQMTFAGNPVQVMSDLSTHQKLMLLSLVLACRSSGLSFVTFDKVCDNHWQLLRVNGMDSTSFVALQGIFSQLESLRLVGRRESGAVTINTFPTCAHSPVRLCVPEEEVTLALKHEAILNKHLQV